MTNIKNTISTIALLRTVDGYSGRNFSVRSYSTLNDNGGGEFYWDSLSVETDNDGTIIAPTGISQGRWKRRFSGALHAEWFGVKANAIQITDGYRGQTSNHLTSASGLFTPNMVGRSVLIREPDPTSLASSTITIAGTNSNQGGFVTGSSITTDFPAIAGSVGDSYEPASGGNIYVNGTYYSAFEAIISAQELVLYQSTSTQTAQPWYTQVHRIATVVSYVSPTEIILSISASVTQSNVWVTIATDDTAAITNCWATAFNLGIHKVIMPNGLCGISSNIGFTSKSNLTIEGLHTNGSGFVDLRKISSETPYPNATNYYGAISFYNCTNIHLKNLSYDANVPGLGTVHSAGGSINNSGSRAGFSMISCADSSYIGLRSRGFGARDEHCYVQGTSPNFLIQNCNVVGNNNVSFNVNGGVGGVKILDCWATGILGAADTLVISRNHVTSNGHQRLEGGITVSNIGHIIVSENTIYNTNHYTAGTGLLVSFGGTDVTATLEIKNNTIISCNGLFNSGQNAIIDIADHYGTVSIHGNTIDDCTASVAGRFMQISGVHTGSVTIGPNLLRGRAGSLMSKGIEVLSGVPSGTVTISPDVFYGESVTTKLILGASLGTNKEITTISSSGTTLLSSNTSEVIITVDGYVSAILSDPTKCIGRRVTVKNDTTQTNTTDVGSSIGSIDGSSLASLVGPLAAATFLSDGTNWKIISGLGSGVSGSVPISRTISATAPIRIDGGGSSNLSSNRTLSLNSLTNTDISPTAAITVNKIASGANNQVLMSDGIIPFWGQLSDGYVSSSAAITGSKITSTTTGALGVIQLATDLGGTATSPNVIRLTGSSNVVSLPSTNVLTWDSSGPTIGARAGTPTDIALKVNTTNSSIALFDTTNLIGFFNWNTGAPYFQQFNGAGFQLLATNGTLNLNAVTASTVITLSTANVVRLTLSDTGFTWASTVATPIFKQADLTTNSGNGQNFTIQSQNATGSTSNGGNLYLQSGTGTNSDGYVAIFTGDLHQRLTIQNTGVVTIANLSTGVVHSGSSGNLTSSLIVDADVSGSAAIAGSKITSATGGALGVIELNTDFGGTATAPNVVQLTGSAGSVSIPTGTALTWASNGPSISDASNDLKLQVNTTNASIKFYDVNTLWAYFNYNTGSPYFQSNGVGFQVIAGGGNLNLNALSTNAITFQTASITRANFVAAGLRLGDGTPATHTLEVAGTAQITTFGAGVVRADSSGVLTSYTGPSYSQLTWNGTAWVGIGIATGVLGDTSPTIQVSDGYNQWVLPSGTLSTGRTITLGTASAVANEHITIVRLDTTANTLTVTNGGPAGGNPYVFPVSKARQSSFSFDGTNWSLVSTVLIN